MTNIKNWVEKHWNCLSLWNLFVTTNFDSLLADSGLAAAPHSRPGCSLTSSIRIFLTAPLMENILFKQTGLCWLIGHWWPRNVEQRQRAGNTELSNTTVVLSLVCFMNRFLMIKQTTAVVCLITAKTALIFLSLMNWLDVFCQICLICCFVFTFTAVIFNFPMNWFPVFSEATLHCELFPTGTVEYFTSRFFYCLCVLRWLSLVAW